MSTPKPVGGNEERITPRWTFGDRLRKIRRDFAKVDQKNMAELLGIDKASYANWEYDRSFPRNLVAIASRLELITGVRAEWVLGLPVPEPTTPEDREVEAAEREEIVQRILAATLRAQGEGGQKIGKMPSSMSAFVSPSGIYVTQRSSAQMAQLVDAVA